MAGFVDKKYKKVVYFVRHGQSEGNVSRLHQSLESPLTEEGRKQAGQIAERIKKLSFDVLIASPLKRAEETAEVIAKITGKKTEYSELFIERVKPTCLLGKPRDDEETRRLNQLWEKSLYTPGFRVEDGENYEDLVFRADKALDFLRDRTEEKIVVVTHGYFLRMLIIRTLLGESLTPEAFKNFQARITSENAGLSALRYGKIHEGMAWRLWVYNDHAHLG